MSNGAPAHLSHETELLASMTAQDALKLVSEMLESLVATHETLKHRTSDRRPSYLEALQQASNVVDNLRVPHTFSVSPEPANADNDATDTAIESDDEGNESADRSFDAPFTDNDPETLYKRFWLKESPKISLSDYLLRFHRYCESSVATYLTAGRLIYILSIERKILPVTRLSIYRLFSAAYIVASKSIEDILYPMKRYATTAGITKQELSQIELSFLLLLKFDVRVDMLQLAQSLHDWNSIRHPALNGMNPSPQESQRPQEGTERI